MVVAVSIYLRTRGLPGGGVRVCHSGGLVRKGIGSGGDVITAQQVTPHPLHLAPPDVVVVCGVNLVTAPRNGHHAARQRPLATHKPVAVVVVLHGRHRVGGGVLPGALSLLCQPPESVIQVVRPLGRGLRAPVAVLREGRQPGVVVHVMHRLRTGKFLVDAVPLPVIPVLESVQLQVSALLVHRLQHEPKVAQVVIRRIGVVLVLGDNIH